MIDSGSWFVAHVGDPFHVAPLVLVATFPDGTSREISAVELSDLAGPLITYDARTLIDALRLANLPLPRTIIDIRDALRLVSGLSKSQGGERLWSFWSYVTPQMMTVEASESIRDVIDARRPYPVRAELVVLLSQTANALSAVWQETMRSLRSRGEYERFESIEVPAAQVFQRRQYLGIALNERAANDLIQQASRQKYTAFRQLAASLGYSPAGLTFFNVGNHLAKTDAWHLAEFADSEQLEQYFKIAKGHSAFASAFLNYVKAGRALSVLRTINIAESRVYPVFECVGTVTSRILVTEPRLQQLPKEFRRIIDADSENELWYFDFAQFEPGVLAQLMGDPRFRTLYHSADVYAALGKAVFQDQSERDLCKSIFLAYCYGMSAERLASLLRRDNSDERAKLQTAISKFFAAFPLLEQLKSSLQTHLMSEGWISSLLGNRRYRTSTGSLFESEKRWALNQAVQGTASLIFKQAILDLTSAFGTESVLLPMHDGIVMQFEATKDLSGSVQEVMASSFKKWCPDVVPRVTVGHF